MRYLDEMAQLVRPFLPPHAELVYLQEQHNQPAILLADIDGDGQVELIAGYKDKGEMYLIVLKLINGRWRKLSTFKGSGYNLTYLLAAPLIDSHVQTIIAGWQFGSIWSELDLLQWQNGKFEHLIPSGTYFSKLEVEDMPSTQGRDGRYEIALWKHDTGDAYQIEIYRWSPQGLAIAKDVYPYYFLKVIPYYQRLIQQMPESAPYWYYLADSQAKAGQLQAALQTIEHALKLPYAYTEKLLQLKREIQMGIDH
ncbi:hypothetical protein Back11_19230 [Paenibacillus baekrokdamisoli]|uniref:Uncharacterized protein n=1 Tax=Paenibacillus baekrokdamisoli TaxID=1712516 RepID=A0A3G9J9N4_9BACL|nr:hypothetical protein [Paenibacillus baekrokdamisoli]MBB3072523.1 tetratricopeptide (TPR) repeat protein [Paenibacillus baekrokdamisoli]BBH20578.1 hypothetical protein Back11_19230 [Paenibacillus baekrokdamisoli]